MTKKEKPLSLSHEETIDLLRKCNSVLDKSEVEVFNILKEKHSHFSTIITLYAKRIETLILMTQMDLKHLIDGTPTEDLSEAIIKQMTPIEEDKDKVNYIG